MKISEDTLKNNGFIGFISFQQLDLNEISQAPGIYVVLKPDGFEPIFLAKSVGGRFKENDPTLTQAELARRWVPEADALYIGKAGPGGTGKRGLRKRIQELADFAKGKPVGHWGGRILWQLEASPSLVIAWKEFPASEVDFVEAALHAEFVSLHGRLPFANLVQARAN